MDQNLFEQKYMEKSWKIKKNPYQKYIIEESVKKWAQFLKEKKIKGKLLDVGCGNGKNSVYFAQKGFKVLGVDFTKEAINLSQKYANTKKSSAKFEIKDITKKQFNNEKEYEVVIDCGCLHHLRKKYWNQYKKNILRLIKEKGYFYLHGFSVNSKRIDNVSKKRNWVVRKGHYTHFFSIKEVQDLFGKDFKIIETYEFKNLNNKFIVRTFYMQRI